MMDLSFLPLDLCGPLSKLNLDKLYELRLRIGSPIKAWFEDKYVYIGNNGYTLFPSEAIICEESYIREIVKRTTEYSEYAHTDKIKRGYLSVSGGIRIGLAGECVFDGDNIVTIKNVSSLNVRFPHEISGCSNAFFNKIFCKDKVFNTIIISPPFCGKTTMLKDVVKKLNASGVENILLIDERGEFESLCGENMDSIKYCDKRYAFTYAVRSLSPKVVITDELSCFNDWTCACSAVSSGVNIIASCHAKDIEDLVNKEYFKKNIFERYVVLSNKKIGAVNGVYDRDLILL